MRVLLPPLLGIVACAAPKAPPPEPPEGELALLATPEKFVFKPGGFSVETAGRVRKSMKLIPDGAGGKTPLHMYRAKISPKTEILIASVRLGTAAVTVGELMVLVGEALVAFGVNRVHETMTTVAGFPAALGAGYKGDTTVTEWRFYTNGRMFIVRTTVDSRDEDPAGAERVAKILESFELLEP